MNPLYPVGENNQPNVRLNLPPISLKKGLKMVKQKSKPKQSTFATKEKISFKVVHSHAAGIDIGSRSNWACIGTAKEQTQEFGVFTEDHHRMAKWFIANGIKTVAMESTGVYWKSLFLILQAHGLQVILVNAGHVKNVHGKKTDMKDCRWIWQLHSVGLLHASFQPDEFTEELRTYNRHRRTLIQGSSQYVSRMQKSLILMNIQLPVVLSDITGKSGKAIIQSILKGERDAKTLANLADYRVRADKATIEKALTGYWHPQHLFTLQQNWEMYQFHQAQVANCDAKVEALLNQKVAQTNQRELVYQPQKKKRRPKTAPKINIDTYAYQLSDGVDLMAIDGFSLHTLLSLVSETGLDLQAKFPSAKHFTSWLGLSPNKKVTGGKTFSSKTSSNKNPLAHAFRQAANVVGNMKDTPLAHFFRRIAFRKGRKGAITATARKLAVIVYNMLAYGQEYNPIDLQAYQEQVRTQKVKHIQRTIQRLKIKDEELVF